MSMYYRKKKSLRIFISEYGLSNQRLFEGILFLYSSLIRSFFKYNYTNCFKFLQNKEVFSERLERSDLPNKNNNVPMMFCPFLAKLLLL